MSGAGRRAPARRRRGGLLTRAYRSPPYVMSTMGDGRRRARRKQRGGDFLGIGNWFRKAGNSVYNGFLKPVGNFIKDKHILSSVAGLIPHPAGKVAGIGLRAVGLGRRRRVRRTRKRGGSNWPLLNMLYKGVKGTQTIAKQLGYGKRRIVRRRGGSLMSILKKGHAYVKSKRLVSSALKHFGHTKLGNSAHALGYGKRRIVRRRRTGGASMFSRIHSYVKSKRLVSNALKHFGHTKLGNSAHALGYGRRRKRIVRRRRTGGSIMSMLKKGHAYVKSKRLVSSALRHFGHIRASNAVGALGYGRIRRRRTIRRRY